MPTKPTAPATFGEVMLHALEHYTDPATLGHTSPLATPYLLGHRLSADDDDATARGRRLQQLLQEATAALTGTNAKLHQAIIKARYFQGKSATATRQVAAISLGKTQYHEQQKRALAALEPNVLQLLNPTLRLEQPVAVNNELLDRESLLNRALGALQERETVALMGPGGVGKTALGSRIAERWGEDTFWFTVRPSINDHLHSFLFELAYFCRLRGAGWLWQELIANSGPLPAARLLALTRDTLAHLPAPPLLCLDEADLLLPTATDTSATNTVVDDPPSRSLLELLTALRGHVAMLIMGQRAALDADRYLELSPLSPQLSNVLFKRHQLVLSSERQKQLYRYTAGNPRLLHLVIALHQSGEPLDELIDLLARSPSIAMLLGRMVQRLSAVERALLMALAVFTTPAPIDVWQRERESAMALNQLHERHLLQVDQQGGVSLLPAYRDAILAELPLDKGQQLHAHAAVIFIQRGRYTLAASHLRHSVEPTRAVALWRDVQQQEINRGQAYPALRLFRSMQSMPLAREVHEQIVLFCATLERIVGNVTAAAADLRSMLVKTPLLQVEADELSGQLANDRGDLRQAEADFRRAIGQAEQLVEVRLAHAYKGLGWRYRNERMLEQAWHNGLLAQYEVANFQGEVQFNRREYADAITHLTTALRLAEELEHSSGIAKSVNNLGRCHATVGEYAVANTCFDRAEQLYQQLGKFAMLDGMAINRAFVWNLSGDHELAVARLEKLLTDKAVAAETPPPELLALIQQNLAEAHLGLGQLDEAERAVQAAIALEEINVLPDALRTHGEIQLARGFPEQARQLIDHALDLIAQMETPDAYLAGYAWRALGHVYTALGDKKAAAEVREEAIACFEAINLPNEVKTTQVQLANR